MIILSDGQYFDAIHEDLVGVNGVIAVMVARPDRVEDYACMRTVGEYFRPMDCRLEMLECRIEFRELLRDHCMPTR